MNRTINGLDYKENCWKIFLGLSILLFLLSLTLRITSESAEQAAIDMSRKIEKRLDILERYADKAITGNHSQWMQLEGLPQDMVVYRYVYDTLQSWSHQFPVGNDDIGSRLIFYRLSNLRGSMSSPLSEARESPTYINLGSKWYVVYYVTDYVGCKVIGGMEVKDNFYSDVNSTENGVNRKLRVPSNYFIMPISYDGGSTVYLDSEPMFKVIAEARPDLPSVDASMLRWVALLLFTVAVVLYLSAHRTRRAYFISLAILLAMTFVAYFWGLRLQGSLEIFSPNVYADGHLFYSFGSLLIVNTYIFLYILCTYIVRNVFLKKVLLGGSRFQENLYYAVVVALFVLTAVYIHFSLRSLIMNSNISLELYAWNSISLNTLWVYISYTALFLALLGAFWSQGRNKWWIIAVSLLMILLAWGRNFMGFTELAFKCLPGYNKFRTVSMTLVVVQWAVPLLGAFALMQLWKGGMPRERIRKGIAWAAGITGGLCLLFALAGGSLFDFGRAASADQMSDTFRQVFAANGLQSYIDRGMDAEWGDAVAQAIAADRAGMMQADAWRSLGMILLAAGCVALWAARRIGRGTAVALLAAVMLLDLVPVDRRFLSDENFVSPRRTQVTPSAADRAIMQDTEPGYRVLNLTVSPFNDATTSYFHRSVGGYHGAKLARYQDLIDRYLNDLNPAVLDMLNTRYVIVAGEDGQPQAQRRTSAFGAAWFVDSLAGAASAQEEIDLLEKVDLRTTAVVKESQAQGYAPRPMPLGIYASAHIELTEYRPNYLRYEYSAPEKAVAVFSEIYYDKGWTAYVDGQEAPYFRADYVLRAMELPAGEHVVEWRFRAPGWSAVEAVTGVCSALILLGAAAAIVYAFRKKKHLCHER